MVLRDRSGTISESTKVKIAKQAVNDGFADAARWMGMHEERNGRYVSAMRYFRYGGLVLDDPVCILRTIRAIYSESKSPFDEGMTLWRTGIPWVKIIDWSRRSPRVSYPLVMEMFARTNDHVCAPKDQKVEEGAIIALSCAVVEAGDRAWKRDATFKRAEPDRADMHELGKWVAEIEDGHDPEGYSLEEEDFNESTDADYI
jgi:hypothetical protein